MNFKAKGKRITNWTVNCWRQKSLHSLCVGCLRLALNPQDLAPLVPVYFQNLRLAQPLAFVLASSDKGDA